MSRTANPVSGYISVENFDPNKSLGSQKFWLTYTGTIQLRRTRGPAISDFIGKSYYAANNSPAKLFEWDPSVPGWVLLAYKDPSHPAYCDHCGLTTVDHPRERDWVNGQWVMVHDYNAPQKDFGRWCFLRKGASRKLVEPLTCEYLCQLCQEQHA